MVLLAVHSIVNRLEVILIRRDFDQPHLAGDAVGPLAEGALEDVHIVLNNSPARAVWGLKPVVLSFLF